MKPAKELKMREAKGNRDGEGEGEGGREEGREGQRRQALQSR